MHSYNGPGISEENKAHFRDADCILTGPKKGIYMARNGSESIRVLINHWRWLEANGYKRQAASCKRQASSLTRKHYNDIVSYKLKEKVK